MNNLHRELAPISAAAWAGIEEEATRTFERHVAGRRIADMQGPSGPALSAAGTGHLRDIDPPAQGVIARARTSQPIIELRVPFAEDRAVFEGYPAAGITGIRQSSSNPALALPTDALAYPNIISQAVSSLRLAGVNGPYSVLLSADAYTLVTETSDHGYPIHQHLARVADGEIIWAPAIDGAFVLSTRGGDFELHIGQDLSIGYLSHDATSIGLYLQESLTFSAYTSEAAVALTA